MTDLVLRADEGGIATLTLNRADKRNALNLALWAELDAHISNLAAAGDAIGVVVLRANGPVFCAGNDLKERGGEAPRPHYQASIVTRLAELPQPVIVAVQGGCFTGGLELALAGDIIVAAESAHFADTHGKFGLVPIWGMSQRLPRRVGEWKAREMSFTGLPVDGREAARIGLANHCVAPPSRATASSPTSGCTANKPTFPLAAGLAHEVFNSAGVAPDVAERVARQF